VLHHAERLTTPNQSLQETERFRRWRQEKVAKIVQCGEHFFYKTEEEASKRDAEAKRIATSNLMSYPSIPES